MIMLMIMLTIGLFIGCAFGVFIAGICRAAANSDAELDRMMKDYRDEHLHGRVVTVECPRRQR